MCLFRAGLCQSLPCAHSVPSSWVHTGTPPQDPAPPGEREQIVRSRPTHCWKGPPAPVSCMIDLALVCGDTPPTLLPSLGSSNSRDPGEAGALGHVGAVCLGQGEAEVHCGQNVSSLVSPASFPGLSPFPQPPRLESRPPRSWMAWQASGMPGMEPAVRLAQRPCGSPLSPPPAVAGLSGGTGW